MTKILLAEHNVEFHVKEGDIHEVNTEDGIGYYPIAWIVAVVDGVPYITKNHLLAKMVSVEDDYILYSTDALCKSLIETIRERGVINLEHWDKYEPVERDLEAEWHQDWIEEQRQRGYAA